MTAVDFPLTAVAYAEKAGLGLAGFVLSSHSGTSEKFREGGCNLSGSFGQVIGGGKRGHFKRPADPLKKSLEKTTCFSLSFHRRL